VRIWVYQGECTEDELKNTKIGEFRIENLKLAPAGVTEVSVTFTIDADGILHVKAVEKGKENNQKSLTITKNVM
jgi:molecular chaperone DnaK (HSP70)